jgi:DNA polymerase-3 subunit beta
MMETEAVVAQGTLKAVLAREELARALGIVSRGVSTRTTVQILSGILLDASEGTLRLAATDMELSLRTSIDAQIESQGSVVVQGRLLLELARLLPEAEVAVEHKLEEAVVEIRCGSATYRLHTYNAEDFPRLPEADAVERHEVDRETLLETVARVSRSASRDESRPVLTGVLMRFEPGKLVMAATDSYRLSVKETPLEGSAPELEAIIPARALGELARIAQAGERIELGVHENQVVFSTGDALLTTRRIDGQFPNYKQLIPETFDHELALPRDELLEVVRRVAVMAQRNSPLRLSFADGELQRRAARDRVQRGVPARRGRVRGRRPGAPEADQPAPPRPDPGRGRRLPVPDHADPPGRLEQADRRRGLAPGLPLVREARRRAGAWSRAGDRPERGWQDEPARVAARGHAGLLSADADRRAARTLRP